MASISTHVLDLVQGRPARGVRVVLSRTDPEPAELSARVTDGDGRVRDLADGVPPGRYQLAFDLATYFAPDAAPFLTGMVVFFEVGAEDHYHVPLLASPYAASTYRGS
jgi:5-hydroxyisourate hydrolase